MSACAIFVSNLLFVVFKEAIASLSQLSIANFKMSFAPINDNNIRLLRFFARNMAYQLAKLKKYNTFIELFPSGEICPLTKSACCRRHQREGL
jgi:hypothetical protein